MRISDWSSDVCSSDLKAAFSGGTINVDLANDYRDKTVTGAFGSFYMTDATGTLALNGIKLDSKTAWTKPDTTVSHATAVVDSMSLDSDEGDPPTVDNWSVNLESIQIGTRSEEHTSELQSLMRITYADF